MQKLAKQNHPFAMAFLARAGTMSEGFPEQALRGNVIALSEFGRAGYVHQRNGNDDVSQNQLSRLGKGLVKTLVAAALAKFAGPVVLPWIGKYLGFPLVKSLLKLLGTWYRRSRRHRSRKSGRKKSACGGSRPYGRRTKKHRFGAFDEHALRCRLKTWKSGGPFTLFTGLGR